MFAARRRASEECFGRREIQYGNRWGPPFDIFSVPATAAATRVRSGGAPPLAGCAPGARAGAHLGRLGAVPRG